MLSKKFIWGLIALGISILACSRQAPAATPWNPSNLDMIKTPCPAGVDIAGVCLVTPTPTIPWFLPPTRSPDQPILTPTPDDPRIVPTLRLDPEEYIVQSNDTLAIIANRYSVSYEEIARLNEITDPNSLSVGQFLLIPAPTPAGEAPDFKVIPDSELVYGPMSTTLDLPSFVESQGGFLAGYAEEVDGKTLTGSEIIQKVSEDFSVNPRLFLSVLEYTGSWVTSKSVEDGYQKYPLGYFDENRSGLYKQMAFAANNLNRGFYLWKVNAVPAWLLADGSIIPVNNTINAGTAGVQQLMAALYTQNDWLAAVSDQGIFQTYSKLFGYPFDFAIEPLLPADLKQPALQLPFEPGISWSFTGGPHPGYGEGSAWAALDFAPPGEVPGCVDNDAWIIASASGLVVKSEGGMVVTDLDGDGFVQNGWSVLYLHVATKDRIKSGNFVTAGDKIGHPSCEGGVSTGTHLHIARRYNGMWISADGDIPFDLDGWSSTGSGAEYDGLLVKDGLSIEAWNGKREENQIQR